MIIIIIIIIIVIVIIIISFIHLNNNYVAHAVLTGRLFA